MIYCVTLDPCIQLDALLPLYHLNHFIDGEGDFIDPLTTPLLVMDYMCGTMKYYVNLKINNRLITRGRLYPVHHLNKNGTCTITDNNSDLISVGIWDHSLILDPHQLFFTGGQVEILCQS